jgi:hypothetical protein
MLAPRESWSDMSLKWRALDLAASGAVDYNAMWRRIRIIAVGLVRLARVLESYAAKEISQAFRLEQLPGAFDATNPVVMAARLDVTYTELGATGQPWTEATSSMFQTYGLDHSGPMDSFYTTSSIAKRIAVFAPPSQVPIAALDDAMAPTGRATALDWAKYTRLMEMLLFHLQHRDIGVPGTGAEQSTIPMRAAYIRNVGAELLAAELSCYKEIIDHVRGWASHPWATPQLVQIREEYITLLSSIDVETGRLPAYQPWPEYHTLAARPPAAIADMEPWLWLTTGLVTRPGQQIYRPGILGEESAFAADRNMDVLISPSVHALYMSWLRRLVNEITDALQEVKDVDLTPTGGEVTVLDLSGELKELTSVDGVSDPLRWHGREATIPITSLNHYLPSLTDESGATLLDPASITTIVNVGIAHGLARQAGVVHHVRVSSTQKIRGRVSDRTLVPVTKWDLIRGLPFRERSRVGLFALWEMTEAEWPLRSETIPLDDPSSIALRDMASALRFVGRLGVSYSQGTAKAAKTTVITVAPNERHWYHADENIVSRFLAPLEQAIKLIGPRTVRVTVKGPGSIGMIAGTSDAEAELLLYPFAYVPTTSDPYLTVDALLQLPSRDIQASKGIFTWRAVSDEQAGFTNGKVPDWAPEIQGWSRRTELIGDVRVLRKKAGDADYDGLITDLMGTATSARWTAKKNGPVLLVGTTDIGVPPAQMSLTSDWDDPEIR